MALDEELRRLTRCYEQRGADSGERYSLFRIGELFMKQGRERQTLAALRSVGITTLAGKRALEVGCGRGERLFDFVRWGCNAKDLAGIDILPAFVRDAKSKLPCVDFSVASAHALPFGSSEFDLVSQSTVFTSILDDAFKKQIASEMMRVTRPGGWVLWYDFRYPNPSNRAVRPIGRKEIQRLFIGDLAYYRSLTLLPPLARGIAPTSTILCELLEKIPLLRSHSIALIRKPV